MIKFPKETDFFLDMEDEYAQAENAKYVLVPVPYDGTSTFVKGADRGPKAIIEASDSLELYDVVYGIEAYTAGIHTDVPVSENTTPDAMVSAVYERVKQWMQHQKVVGLLGGEHSVSEGAIRAALEKYPDLTVLQVDAHADQRDEYHGSPHNHACVMRRAQTLGARVVQVGIRSVEAEEKKNMLPENVFYAHEIVGQDPAWMQRVCERLTGHVYLTIDLDGLDSSVLPATGTPLPGGLSWYELTRLLDRVFRTTRIVGFDVVELCPQPESVISDVLAASLVYRIITLCEVFGNA
ncbi:MAG: agmatinase [Bacteroidales bacterium]|nr:agmatinase [Bacteroidales bacterium]